MGYNRIVTHNDFDGVVCAALCSHIYGMENIFFTGPRDILNCRHPTNMQDIVTDLPYPIQCGMWFDHHPGNLEDLKLRGLTPEEVPGRFREDPSCARTVFDYFSEEWEIESYLEDTVDEADILDSFAFSSLEEWRTPTPGKNVDASIKAPFEDNREKNKYLKKLALWIRDFPLEEIQHFEEVAMLRQRFLETEEESRGIIRNCARFLPEDTNREIVIVDVTGYRSRPFIVRHMAYLEFPEALAAIVVGNPMVQGIKTTNLNFSMSLSVLMNNREHVKNVGNIMRTLNLGDGHSGAGAGIMDCRTKDEMIRTRENILNQIYHMWQEQV